MPKATKTPDRPVLDAALCYAARGWQVFPARFVGDTKKSHKSAKLSNGHAWGKTTDAGEVRRDFERWPHAGIGIATGAETGFFVVETDTIEGHDVDGAASLRALEADHGALPNTLMAESPTGSVHRYFKHPGGDTKITKSTLGPGVDVKGDGGMVIAPPSLRPGKGAYKWLNSNIIADAPNWLLKLLTTNEAAPTPNENKEAEIERVIAALAIIPNGDDIDRAAWVDVGQATFAATRGSDDGFAAFDAWSRPHKTYNARKTVVAWKSFKPKSIGAGKLFYLAKQAWPGWQDDPQADAVITKFARTLPEQRGEGQTEGEGEGEGATAGVGAERPASGQKSRDPNTMMDDPLIFHGDADYEPPRWLVHERIPETGVGLLAGQFGMFKTFHAIDLVGAIVTEHEWLGRPVCRRGGVLFIAAEGAYDLPRRLSGLIKDKIEPQLKQSASTLIDPQRLPIAWKSKCLPLVSKDNAALPELVKVAAEAQAQFNTRFNLELVLIVFDTMAAVAGWEDENDNAQAQRAMTVLHKLSMATGAFVIAVDHYGKNPLGGARGASAREASADVVLASLGDRDEDGQVSDTRLTLRKARSGPSGLVFPFETRMVELGFDDYDRPVTTLTIDWDVERSEPDKPKGQSLTLLEQVMTELVTKSGETNGGVQTVARPAVRAAFQDAYRKSKPDANTRAVNEAFRRALEQATHNKTVEGNAECLWLAAPNY